MGAVQHPQLADDRAAGFLLHPEANRMSAERFRVATPEPERETTHAAPVHVTYTRQPGDVWDATAECDDLEVVGFPMLACPDLEAARACAWTLLRQIQPPRPVAEHVAGEDVAEHAAGWALRGGTTI